MTVSCLLSVMLLYLVVCLTLPLSSDALVSTSLPANSPLLTFDDGEECVIPEETATVEHILNESALARGLEIAGVVVSKLVVPLCSSVLSQGLTKDWDEFWARTHGDGSSNAEHLTHALEELGPVYVKFGQTLASRPDAVPLPLANSLSKIQDCMEPLDAESAKWIVTQELLESKK